LSAQSGRGEQEAENLWVCLGCPPRCEVEQKKHQDPAKQTAQKVESSGTDAHCEKEELSLRAENCQGP